MLHYVHVKMAPLIVARIHRHVVTSISVDETLKKPCLTGANDALQEYHLKGPSSSVMLLFLKTVC